MTCCSFAERTICSKNKTSDIYQGTQDQDIKMSLDVTARKMRAACVQHVAPENSDKKIMVEKLPIRVFPPLLKNRQYETCRLKFSLLLPSTFSLLRNSCMNDCMSKCLTWGKSECLSAQIPSNRRHINDNCDVCCCWIATLSF